LPSVGLRLQLLDIGLMGLVLPLVLGSTLVPIAETRRRGDLP
jgi:hypothetical protein